MHISRSFVLLFALSLLALVLAAPQPLQLVDIAIGAVIFAALIALGLRAAAPFGRGAPLLEQLGRTRPDWPRHLRNFLQAFLAGALLGAVLLVLLFILTSIEPAASARLAARADQPLWVPVVLAVESSILEELVFRLFLMSGLIWLMTRFGRVEPAGPARAVLVVALVISALAFGLVHLPAWLALAAPTPLLVTAVLALNGLGGLLLGLVYWRWGIEAAILCHLAGDLVVQGLGPRLFGG
jgi:membrane protease YdiL (CAAX protease family)